MKDSRILVASIAVVVLMVPGTATAIEIPKPTADQGPVVVSGAGGQFYGYVTPVMAVQSGGELSYANFDIVQHDVVHDTEADGIVNKKKDRWCKAYDKGQCPLFWSPRAGLGDVVPVEGLANLKPGEAYTFFCTLHPGMKGQLVVVD